MSTRKSTAERIEAMKTEKAQVEAEIKRLQNLHKAEERKKRNHRICKRGGLIESLLPETIGLSDERFNDFIKRTTANDYGRKTLATLVTEQNKEDSVNNESGTDSGDAPAEPTPLATAQGGKPSAHKSAAPKWNNGDNEKENPAQTANAPNGADGSRTEDATGTGD